MPRWVLFILLPLCWAQPREISGVVVDSNGKPIPGVGLAHSGTDHETSADGTFRVTTNAPTVVFRLRGFTSVFRRTDALKDAKIQMSPTQPLRFPACKGNRLVKPIDPTRVLFKIPKARGVEALPPVVDVDYMIRTYRLVSNRSSKMEHRHGISGPQTLPPDETIWLLANYAESVREAGGTTILDARGTTETGLRWRSLRKIWETVSYNGLPAEEAAIFDRAIDGVCAVN